MEKFTYPDFGKRLKEARGKRTQADLAREVGVTQGAIAKYEKGMAPQAGVLERIASTLGVTSRYLLSGVEDEAQTRKVTDKAGNNYEVTSEGLTGEDLALLEMLKAYPEKYLAAKDIIKLNNEEVFDLRVEISQKLRQRDGKP